MNRTLVVGLGAVVVMGVALQTFALPPGYTITDLGTLDGSSRAYAINNAGDIVGFCEVGGLARATLWSGGGIIDLGRLGGGESVAYAINEHRQIVGKSSIGSGGGGHAFLWESGVMNDIDTLGSSWSVGHAIANDGTVVGSYTYLPRAFCYSSGAMVEIQATAGSEAVAWGINEHGEIVGDVGDKACLWHDDVVELLGTPPGYAWSATRDINNQGHVAGSAGFGLSGEQAFLYKDGGTISLGTLGGSRSEAEAINNLEQIVGNSEKLGSAHRHAFIWEDGTMYDLNDLLPPDAEWTLWQANDINDAGEIVGTGINPQGQWRAYLMTPIPEPATLGLLAMGLGAVWMGKRQGTKGLRDKGTK